MPKRREFGPFACAYARFYEENFWLPLVMDAGRGHRCFGCHVEVEDVGQGFEGSADDQGAS